MRPPDATSASLTSLQLHDLQVGDGTSYDAGLTLLQDGQETDITDLLDLTGSSVSWDGRQLETMSMPLLTGSPSTGGEESICSSCSSVRLKLTDSWSWDTPRTVDCGTM